MTDQAPKTEAELYKAAARDLYARIRQGDTLRMLQKRCDYWRDRWFEVYFEQGETEEQGK